MEKNPSAGSAALNILQRLDHTGNENVGVDLETKVIAKLEQTLTPKRLKLLCTGPALQDYCLFALGLLKTHKNLTEIKQSLLLTVQVANKRFLADHEGKLLICCDPE